MKSLRPLGCSVLLVFACSPSSESPSIRATSSPISVFEEAKMLPSDGAPADWFGWQVARRGPWVLAGAPQDDDSGSRSGSAYFFRSTGASWVEHQKVEASDPAAAELFGYAVDVSGSTAVVGAMWDGENGSKAGAAYVFEESGGTWTETRKLLPSVSGADFNFGRGVAIDGNTIAVGADGEDAAYVFVRSGGVWTEQQRVTPSGPTGAFGFDVDLEADTLVVGTNSPNGFVYTRSGGVWSEEAEVTGTSSMGWIVGVSGDTAVFGSQIDSATAPNAGAVYVFVRAGTTWSQDTVLRASDGQANAYFGEALSISGDLILVGADRDSAVGNESGSAYLYERQGPGVWSETKILASDANAGAWFGISVHLDGELAVVGAQNESASGAAYAYDFADLGPDGAPCSFDGKCASGFCVDGVCCESACGGGDDADCEACSVASGAAADGTCALVSAGQTCNAGCASADVCDGASSACPNHADADGDGTLDCNDGCPNDAGKLEPGVCGCGSADLDGDGDGTPDCNDGCPGDPDKAAPGDCGCGTADADSDGDGTPDCNDGCPSDPDKTASGDCGCGTADDDRDGDGTPDCNDACPSQPGGSNGCPMTPDGGTAGTAGMTGNGGAPGTAGTANAGAAGALGSAGAPGGSGAPGTAGTPGSSGAPSTAGAAGSVTGGTAGTVSGDSGAGVTVDSGDDGGCGCRIAERPTRTPFVAWAALVAGIALRRRRPVGDRV